MDPKPGPTFWNALAKSGLENPLWLAESPSSACPPAIPAVGGPFFRKLDNPPRLPAEFKGAPGVPGTERLGIGGNEAIEADMSAPPALGPVGDSRLETLALAATPLTLTLLLLLVLPVVAAPLPVALLET